MYNQPLGCLGTMRGHCRLYFLCLTQAKGNPESSFNDENLRMVVGDLFIAGMVTTSTTLSWALLLMILHPDVQCKPG